MRPALGEPGGYGVALVGEALGAEEAEVGSPFVGRAGFKLTRLLEWAGLDRSKFDIYNCVWCRPPSNRLEGESYEHEAINHCRSAHWDSLTNRVRVVVPMGNVALNTFTGRKGILTQRGYITPGPGTTHLVPTVHPSFIQRGQSKYSAAFIHDVQKAVTLAREGLPVERVGFLIDPSPSRAYEWAQECRSKLLLGQGSGSRSQLRLAYDIETPTKSTDEGSLGDVEDPTYFIWRIGFSYEPFRALSIPWTPPYIPAIRLLLESDGEKVVWNAGFDNPRIRANGVNINGLIHDGMVAWHVLHSDLPKGLGFVATFTCPWQSAWKHLSHSQPGFYNATDADVEARSMTVIEEQLRETGLWGVYQRDVLDLEPILQHMTRVGMPIDHEIRYNKAVLLAEKQEEVSRRMEESVPVSARSYAPKEGYVKEPDTTDGCIQIRVECEVARCGRCGMRDPRGDHFSRRTHPIPGTPGRKRVDRSPNGCYGERNVVCSREVIDRWAKLDPFKPSRHQLMRYQGVMKRRVPTMWDKKSGKRKPTMNEKAIKELLISYPNDPLYKDVLWYRTLDKIGGTYIGRPV